MDIVEEDLWNSYSLRRLFRSASEFINDNDKFPSRLQKKGGKIEKNITHS